MTNPGVLGPPLDAVVTCRLVQDTPGAAHIALTFEIPAASNLAANATVKQEFANFV